MNKEIEQSLVHLGLEEEVKSKEEKFKTSNIVYLYACRKLENIVEKYKEKEDIIMESSSINKEITRRINELLSYLRNHEIQDYVLDFSLPKDYQYLDKKEELAQLEKEVDKELGELLSFSEEIATQLSACDTYEQEIEVLKIYKVLTKSGTINKK